MVGGLCVGATDPSDLISRSSSVACNQLERSINIFMILSSPLDVAAWPLLSMSSLSDSFRACVVETGAYFDPGAFLAFLDWVAKEDAPRFFFPLTLGAMA